MDGIQKIKQKPRGRILLIIIVAALQILAVNKIIKTPSLLQKKQREIPLSARKIEITFI